MWFRQPRKKPEKTGAQRLINLMRSEGWKCRRLNVSAGIYSTPGFPDYFCTHYKYGQRWIETKALGMKLRQEQAEFARDCEVANIGVWVCHDEKDYQLLFEKPNWWRFLK